MTQLMALIHAAVTFGTVILFGALGEILTEKAGNLNLGVPGIMYLGGIAGLMGTFFYESAAANPNPFLCVLSSPWPAPLRRRRWGAFCTASSPSPCGPTKTSQA